jgi:toxin-antitoxin system PIN domain toxin
VKLVDVNVLLYAVNRDAEHHEAALAWWQDALSGDESIGLAWSVLLGFLRIAANPKIFPTPVSAAGAIKHIDAWLTVPNVCVITEKPEHWKLLRVLLKETGVAGNLTTDAQLAALAISHGASLVSFDRDFVRFEGLRWETPLS